MKRFACLTALLLSSVIVLGQQFSSVPGQGRSMVVTKSGIVSTPQFLASQAGAHILEEGGNAIDAAIAANAVMGVVQPYVNGIGGDLFVLYYEAKTGKVYGLNSSGWTPKALTIEYLKSKGVTSINPIGVETIDVPGAVAGWDALRTRFGNLPLASSSLRPSTTRRTDSLWPSAMPATGSPKGFSISPDTRRLTTSGPLLRNLVTCSRIPLSPTRYAATLRPSGEYRLKIPYRTDEELDKTMVDLLQHIAFEADLRNCFSESNAQLEGSQDRTW